MLSDRDVVKDCFACLGNYLAFHACIFIVGSCEELQGGLRWSMYHSDANERQGLEIHMVRKEGGRKNQVTGHRQQSLTLPTYRCGQALSRASFETPTPGTD